MTNRHGWLCCLVLAFVLLPIGVIAQTATTDPEDEYKKLVKVNTEIKPIGENPFGESVNVFDGSISFHVVDISVPGTGPTIEIGRTFHADGDSAVRWSNSEFGDWDLDYPRLTTLTSAQDTIIQGPNQIGWLVNSLTRTDRCTNFREPPDQRIGRPGTEPLTADAWWNQGYTLQIPGISDQDMLFRNATSPAAPTVGGLNYVAVSKERWHLGCLASTANGEEGEAFMAVGPNGQKYWLNELLYRPARSFGIVRKLGVMAVTRMEDRFGNALTYNWSGTQLASIVASDGRVVTFEYAADGVHVSKINVVTSNSGARSWTYAYTAVPEGGAALSSVTLPDGSAWTYSLSDLTFDVKSSAPPGHCNDVSNPPDVAKVGLITGPSGLQGRFEAHPTRHARSDVPEACSANIPSGQGSEMRPRYTNNLALTVKTFSGAGLSPQTWTYQYPLATASWRATCQASGCDRTSQSLVVDPSLNTTRYTFFNSADANEGKPVRTEYFKGDTAGPLLRTEMFEYAAFNQGPWPAAYGGGFNVMANLERQEGEVPQSKKVITQDGDTYTWQALQFDAYARPSVTRRFSSLNAAFTVDEGHTYLDNTDRSIIGLPLAETNVTKNAVVSQNNYDANLVLASRDHFGLRAMNYTFNPQGQLASFTDPLLNTTSLSAYTLGIPTIITFPDKTPDHPNGTTETLSVDGFGQITAITDQTGATTSYSYDAIGRVAQTSFPAGDSVAWAPRVFTYTYSADARGMGGNHWVRTITQGTYAERTDFDAMLRPVMTGKAEAGTGALYVSTRTEYDWAGRKVFESYAVDGAPDRGSIGQGTSTAYDALGREVSRTQSAELDGVTTSTAYLAGGVRRVTDPNGNVVDTVNQAFDEPVSDRPVSVSTSDGVNPVVQTIARNVYGNPEQITQGGVVRKIYYDAQQRVCRTFDPETQSEMTAYDAAGNTVWTASGQPVDGDSFGCGYDQVTASAKINRTFDGMNRPATVTYPGGTVAVAFTYDPLGNPATAVSTTATASPNTTGTVNWSFGRNRRGLLTAEVLSTGAMSWGIGYGYDANGNLASTQYPDGKLVPVAPNALGQPTAAGVYATAATYHPDGQLKSFALGNGAMYSMTPTTRTLIGNFTFGSPGALAISEDFAYDRNANITSISDVAGGAQRSRTFTYDGLNRLTSATSGLWGNESYTYDAANNIRSITNSSGLNTYTYDAANRLQSISGASTHTFQYDAQGNTTKRDSQVMVFDLANRLLSVTGKGDYLYDASGRRVRSMSPSGTTYYAYNAAGQLLWQFDPATNAGTDYIYLGTKLVASTSGAASTATVPVLTAPPSVLVNVAYAVSWTAVMGTTSYELQEKTGNGAWATVATGTALSKSLTHTAAGTFSYQVRACNGATCGAYSTAVSTVVATSVAAPGAPTNLVLTLSADERNITLGWAAAARATSYSAQFNGGSWTDVYAGPSLSTPVATPTADGIYSFRVKACNAAGCSIYATSGALVVHHTPPPPATITVPATSSGAVTVSWSRSPYAGNYYLDQSTDGVSFTTIWSSNALSTTRTLTVTGNYYFRVHACNADKCGGYGPVGVSTVTIPPAGVTSISAPGTNYTGCYAISWTAVTGATSYIVQEKVNNGAFTVIPGDSTRTLSFCGKTNGSYAYRIQACNAGGCGPYSGTATINVVLPPSAPGGVKITQTATGTAAYQFTGSWTAVSDAQRYEILNGAVTVYNGGGTSFVLQSGSSPTLSGSFSIRACNQAGCSADVPFPAP